ALGKVTSYTNYVNSAGQSVRQITYPNSSTRIETRNRDGTLTNVLGTAVHGVRYEYGVESDGGVQRAFSKEIKLDRGGSDTSEWIKNYTDMVHRKFKTDYPDGASSQTIYNTNGNMSKNVDSDGVTDIYL